MQQRTDRARRASLADEVARELRRRILGGEFAPGERLPTGNELATDFGVSMSVVREALARLKHDGLVHTVQGAGAFVAERPQAHAFRLEDSGGQRLGLQRVFELRQAVEGEAARLAAVRRTSSHLRELREALAEMEGAVIHGTDGTQADTRFHFVVAEATGNPLFPEMYAFLSAHIRMAIEAARLHSELRGTWHEAHQEHQRIYRALEEGDPEGARHAILMHIGAAARRLGVADPETLPRSLVDHE